MSPAVTDCAAASIGKASEERDRASRRTIRDRRMAGSIGRMRAGLAASSRRPRRLSSQMLARATPLFVMQGVDRIQARGLDRRDHAENDADQAAENHAEHRPADWHPCLEAGEESE